MAVTAPVDRLIRPELQVCAPAATVDAWNVTDSGKDALRRWGLARLGEPRFTVAIQRESDPQLVYDRYALYTLGTFPNLQIGVSIGNEEVVGIQESTTVPAVFQEAVPEIVFANSSLSHFVDFCWRWLWARRAIHELWVSGNSPPHGQIKCLRQYMQLADPGIEGREKSSSLWPGFINGLYP